MRGYKKKVELQFTLIIEDFIKKKKKKTSDTVTSSTSMQTMKISKAMSHDSTIDRLRCP